MRRWMVGCAGLVALGAVGLGALWLGVREPLPEGRTGAGADALAARLEGAVGLAGWQSTGAIQWRFAGRDHLWDRDRQLYKLDDGGGDVVLMDLQTRDGRAWSAGRELAEAERSAALERAWSIWCNDTFWLNPLEKLRDPGITLREVDQPDGPAALLVSYSSGGVTPGDSYLWLPGEDGRPSAWRMWVSIIPIPGLETSWEGWTQLSTGAWVSTLHRIGPVEMTVDGVKAAASISELVPGDDPFAELVDR